MQHIFNIFCSGGFHDNGNSGFKRPHALAGDYKENAENQQIKFWRKSKKNITSWQSMPASSIIESIYQTNAMTGRST